MKIAIITGLLLHIGTILSQDEDLTCSESYCTVSTDFIRCEKRVELLWFNTYK